jgi:hypothetical protein
MSHTAVVFGVLGVLFQARRSFYAIATERAVGRVSLSPTQGVTVRQFVYGSKLILGCLHSGKLGIS